MLVTISYILLTSLLVVNSVYGQGDDTAALIVGGFWSGSPGGPLMTSAELFGCMTGYGEVSVPVQDSPLRGYLSGGLYLEEEEAVLLCGGFTCEGGCGAIDSCYYWFPGNNTWAEAPPLNEKRFNFLATTIEPNSTILDESQAPFILGGSTYDTEVFSRVDDAWLQYDVIEARDVYALGCLISYNDLIYSLKYNLISLDPTSWDQELIMTPTDRLANPGMCSGLTINGDPGIFTRYGFWYNLNTEEWVKKNPPPIEAVSGLKNALLSFRERPTLFGHPSCNNMGYCEDKLILQYMPDTDSWKQIGEMTQPRVYQTVIEIPGKFCEMYTEGIITTTTTTTASTIDPTQTTTTTTTMSTSSPPGRETAVLLIGGNSHEYSSLSDVDDLLAKAELFGCTYADTDSFEITDFPAEGLLSGGVWQEEEERAFVCGGYTCKSGTCGTTSDCYYWYPSNNSWVVAPSLIRNRFNYLMAKAKHIYYPGQGELPLVLGYGDSTEIFNARDNEWQEYFHIPDIDSYATGCLIDYNDKIYSMRSNTIELNKYTWNLTNLGEVPNALKNAGKCSGMTLNGKPGILNRYGFWYDLEDGSYMKKASPPVEPLLGVDNAMWSFRGLPTIFGHPVCNNQADCSHTQVVQYQLDTDEWKPLGEFTHSRVSQTVIEVPGEICDYFFTPPTTTTTTTTTPSTTPSSTPSTPSSSSSTEITTTTSKPTPPPSSSTTTNSNAKTTSTTTTTTATTSGARALSATFVFSSICLAVVLCMNH